MLPNIKYKNFYKFVIIIIIPYNFQIFDNNCLMIFIVQVKYDTYYPFSMKTVLAQKWHLQLFAYGAPFI